MPATARLRAVFEGRRTGPDGKEHGPDAHVFGDEAGGRVGRIATAWNAACRRAEIEDLHFHDLRHAWTGESAVHAALCRFIAWWA